jgi:hypothetical protein
MKINTEDLRDLFVSAFNKGWEQADEYASELREAKEEHTIWWPKGRKVRLDDCVNDLIVWVESHYDD